MGSQQWPAKLTPEEAYEGIHALVDPVAFVPDFLGTINILSTQDNKYPVNPDLYVSRPDLFPSQRALQSRGMHRVDSSLLNGGEETGHREVAGLGQDPEGPRWVPSYQHLPHCGHSWS